MKNLKYISALACLVLLNACADKEAQNSSNNPQGRPDVNISSVPFVPKIPNASQSFSVPLSTGGLKTLEAIHGSVVSSKKDVIVNAANKDIFNGSGSTGAIFAAAGAGLPEEIAKAKSENKIGKLGTKLETSQVFTTAAHNLTTSKYIIHALGPVFGNSDFDKGYGELRATYQNVYAEMNRLRAQYNVTSIAMLPISSSIYAGGADKNTLYKIMIEETLAAIEKYPEVKPSLYLFGKDEYDAVIELIEPAIKTNTSSSSSMSMGGAIAALSLHSNPSYFDCRGQKTLQGSALNLGPMRLMSVFVQGQYQHTASMMLGVPINRAIVGCEIEAGYKDNNLEHYALKATGLCGISSDFSLGASIGYVCENMNLSIAPKIREFLHQLSANVDDYIRQGLMIDWAVQYRAAVAEGVHVATHIGAKAVLFGRPFVAPFVQVSLDMNTANASVFISSHECGFNFSLNN